jgi:tRNA(Arg) A34 adenosine deaminase TadA
MTPRELLQHALTLSVQKSASGENGPFGAVVARGGEIISEGWNQVTQLHDPTAHAEIVAIREACRKLGSPHLHGCLLYASCEPCPMCLAAIYWAHLDGVVYANSSQEAQRAGFDDLRIYRELTLDWPERALKAERLVIDTAAEAFRAWSANPNRVEY